MLKLVFDVSAFSPVKCTFNILSILSFVLYLICLIQFLNDSYVNLYRRFTYNYAIPFVDLEQGKYQRKMTTCTSEVKSERTAL